MICFLHKSKKNIYRLVYNIARYKSDENKTIKSTTSGKIRSLNYETKSLFGAVTKEKNQLSKGKNSIEDDKSSEIFWMTQYVKPIQTLKNKTLRKSNKVKTKTKLMLDTKGISQVSSIKQDDTVIKTEKVAIPFTSNQLNDMLTFPLIYKDSEKLNESLNTNEVKLFPSVTKVLQATMSDFSRNALKQWKTKKIEELGENGFLELQKCKDLYKHVLYHFYYC